MLLAPRLAAQKEVAQADATSRELENFQDLSPTVCARRAGPAGSWALGSPIRHQLDRSGNEGHGGPLQGKGVDRGDGMGLGLRNLGAAWHRRHAANPGAYLHRDVALPVFEVFLALSWKAAEIRRLWLARRRVSNLG